MAGGANPDINRVERAVWWGMLVILGLAAVVRVAAVFTENVNRDEFGLLQRGATLVRSGVLVGSGRPGLGTVLIAPFAEGCVNAVDAVVRARHLWTAMVAAAVAAFAFLLRSGIPPGPMRRVAVSTGVALWVLAPPFLRYSVQVRTDQIAILGGVAGGALLVASSRRPWAAVLAGALMAAGFLGSQKLLYVAALALVLVAMHHLGSGEGSPRRAVTMLGLLALGFTGVVAGFRLATSGSGAPPMLPLEGQLSRFDYYRQTLGFYWYLMLLPALVAQGIAVWHLLPASVAWFRSRTRGALLLGSWLIWTGAVGVVAFHAGRFPYFYMVLGLFPATIGALVVAWLLAWMNEPRARLLLLALIWVPMIGAFVIEARGMMVDDIAHQRESLAFVSEAFPSDARGFGDRHEFVCRDDPNPFPLRSRIDIERYFGGEGNAAQAVKFIDEFRDRPVSFMIPSIEAHRYPEAVQTFWATHYVQYFAHVAVPGRRISGPEGTVASFKPIVAGRYRWFPDADEDLYVDDHRLLAEQTVLISELAELRLRLGAAGGGVFALDVGRPPMPDSAAFFTRYLERRGPARHP